MMSMSCVKYVKACENLSVYCKKCSEIYKDYKCCLKCKEVRGKYFIFECIQCEGNMAVSSKYYISKFPDLFTFCEKDLEKIA